MSGRAKDDVAATEAAEAAEPARFCAVSRVVKPLDELIRFVVAPDGVVLADLRRRLPGRGVSITASAASLAEAIKRKVFARGFGKPVTVPEDLAARVDALLARRALEALSLTAKAGTVVSGATKVEAAARAGRVIGLLHAIGAAEGGRTKLDRLARATVPHDREIFAAEVFTGDEMDLAMGRSHVIHAALIAGPASENCLARCRALLNFRDGGGARVGRSSVRRDESTEASG